MRRYGLLHHSEVEVAGSSPAEPPIMWLVAQLAERVNVTCTALSLTYLVARCEGERYFIIARVAPRTASVRHYDKRTPFVSFSRARFTAAMAQLDSAADL